MPNHFLGYYASTKHLPYYIHNVSTNEQGCSPKVESNYQVVIKQLRHEVDTLNTKLLLVEAKLSALQNNVYDTVWGEAA